MERLLIVANTLYRIQLPLDDLATKDATRTDERRRGATKTTAYDEQDYDLHYAVVPWLLRYYVQRSVCDILLRQQPHNDDEYAYFQPYRKAKG